MTDKSSFSGYFDLLRAILKIVETEVGLSLTVIVLTGAAHGSSVSPSEWSKAPESCGRSPSWMDSIGMARPSSLTERRAASCHRILSNWTFLKCRPSSSSEIMEEARRRDSRDKDRVSSR